MFVVAATACIAFIFLFNFFYIGKYSNHPWWYENGNDADATYAAQTAALINGSSISYMHHPGATIYGVNALVYRAAAMSSEPCRHLTDLNRVENLGQTVYILEMATHLSRTVVPFFAIITVIILLMLIWKHSGSTAMAVLFVFYLAMTPAFFQHTFRVRPELLNVLFLLMSLWAAAKCIEFCRGKLSSFISAGLAFGLTSGLSVLSKIQIGPALALTVITTAICCYQRSNNNDNTIKKSRLPPRNFKESRDSLGKVRKFYTFLYSKKMTVITGIITLCITPWWALVRPAFLTPEYLHSLYYLSDDLRVYGKAPANFIVQFLVVELALLTAALLFPGRPKIKRLVLLAQTFIIGAWLSGYIVLIPASINFPQYIQNTNHLIYAVLTNVTQGGFLINRHLGLETIQEIINMHQSQTALLHISLLWYVAAAALISLFRLIGGTGNRSGYALVLVFFLGGFLMDVVSCMRWTELMIYYLIYSATAYAIGLGLWAGIECRRAREGRRWSYVCVIPVLILLMASGIITCIDMFKHRPPDVDTNQTPARQWENTHDHAIVFWKMAQDSIDRHGH